MACRQNTFTATALVVAPTFALVVLASGSAGAATPSYYNSLAAFTTDITSSVTDDYSNPAYVFIQNNATMNAVLGETDYMTTGFDNLNIVSGGYYCAGCNGSFELSFTTTTVGTPEGVNGVGMTIQVHNQAMPYYAYITFADGDTENILLPAAGTFWGVSAPERIEKIHFGFSMGQTTQSGSFGIDNLIVGDGVDTTPCGDGITSPGEECDDMGISATCDADCTLAECGDTDINALAGETCDEGGMETASCDSDCTAPMCGDGVTNMTVGEDCDDMGESSGCNADCSAAYCGDGLLNMSAGELCDDGGESDACDGDCTVATCGDGLQNDAAGETCDDGNLDDGDGCSASCLEEGGSSSDGGEASSDGGSSGGGTADTGDTGGTGGTGGSGETGIDDSGSGADTGVDTSGASGSASASGTTSAGAESESGGGSSGITTTIGSDPGGVNGCTCTTEDRRGGAWPMLALFGLGALVRRPQRRGGFHGAPSTSDTDSTTS